MRAFACALTDEMANQYGIPLDVEQRLRARDTSCVYCRRQFSTEDRRGWPTIEHLSEKLPFRWNKGLTEDGLAICCWSCNSSRGQKTLHDWFRSRFVSAARGPSGRLT